ncbi:MAG: restriction endonuclease subunit M [Desulfobacteraceae bacterium]|nr:MAG: restriction endonuclease subunit M [Desulfobacteraceae bacterium]
MTILAEGTQNKLITIDDDGKYIVYQNENKRRNFANPEEKVQAEAFLSLILIYNYPPQRIRQFVKVTMGSDTKEADIVVYNDDACTKPHIVVECKKEEVSEAEFEQAANQAFSYAQALAGTIKYVWVTSKIKNAYFRVDKDSSTRSTESDIPQYGVLKLARYKYAKDGGTVGGQRLFELEVVTQDELTRRFKQAHQALWGGGELNPSEAFDELDKLIFCKIWDERKPRKKGEPYSFQVFAEPKADEEEKEEDRLSRENNKLLKRIQEIYEEGRKKDKEVFKDDIRLSASKCRSVVSYLESVNLGKTDLDSKGRAFEEFLGSFFRGDFGQYFTPRPIVKFIVDVLPITSESLVLDTSCGSGGFLLHALDKVRRQAGEYYPQTEGHPETAEHHRHWHDFAKNNLFGIEINEQIARTAKMNMIIHDDGHTNVISADGLLPDDELHKKSGNPGFAYNRFNFIITNPPFGSSVKQTEKAYLSNYRMAAKEVDWLNPKSKAATRPNQSTEVLFIEQCHQFLADGGYLAIVVPDGILTNSSMQYVRDKIEEDYRIVAVVSMPQTAFMATGAGVKSSVLFLKKLTEKQSEKIRNAKTALKDRIKEEHAFNRELARLEKERDTRIKSLEGFANPGNLTGKALKESEAFLEWKKTVNDECAEKIDAFKERLLEQYETKRRELQEDYDIFMAIAEDIGYDAANRPTGNNELDVITPELARFVDAIEAGEA